MRLLSELGAALSAFCAPQCTAPRPKQTLARSLCTAHATRSHESGHASRCSTNQNHTSVSPHPLLLSLNYDSQSEIEETIERIKGTQGVTGYLIVDAEGTVLRKHADMSAADVKKYSSLIRDLSGRARHVVRDLNPTNDLRCMRLKTSNVEILVAPHAKFTVVVIQRWKPAVDP